MKNQHFWPWMVGEWGFLVPTLSPRSYNRVPSTPVIVGRTSSTTALSLLEWSTNLTVNQCLSAPPCPQPSGPAGLDILSLARLALGSPISSLSIVSLTYIFVRLLANSLARCFLAFTYFSLSTLIEETPSDSHTLFLLGVPFCPIDLLLWSFVGH